MTHILDTDICSYLMKRTHPVLIERVKSFKPGELKVSAVTLFELEFGVLRSQQPERLRPIIEGFLVNVEVLPLSPGAAAEAGAVRMELEADGTPIGAYDPLIAGHVRHLGATLVTNNVREFSRVSGLKLEDWLRSSEVTS